MLLLKVVEVVVDCSSRATSESVDGSTLRCIIVEEVAAARFPVTSCFSDRLTCSLGDASAGGLDCGSGIGMACGAETMSGPRSMVSGGSGLYASNDSPARPESVDSKEVTLVD